MNNLLDATRSFLIGLGMEAIQRDSGLFRLVAQNDTLIVLACELGDGLEKTGSAVMTALAPAFRNKKFGPKSMELYVLFLSANSITLSEIEKIEQDARVCRKVVITSVDELDARLSFLKPLSDDFADLMSVERSFWQALEKTLSTAELDLVHRLKEQPLSKEQLAAWLRDAL